MRTQPCTPNPRLPRLSIRATVAALVLLLCAGLSTAIAENFLVNPSFELGTGSEAPPWSLWEGTGGAVANPLVDSQNPSPRVWFNTGGTRNLAAANNVNLILDTTGTITYHVKVKYYVPSVRAGTHAAAMIRYHAIKPTDTTYLAGDPILLDDALPEGDVAPGSWVTKEFDWVNATDMGYLQYLTFRMYSHDDATGLRVNPAPDVYIDECEFSSSQYRNDVHGVVKDNLGASLAGATVSLNNTFGVLETKTTAADGSYAFTTMLPYGAYTVNASKFSYTPNSVSLALSTAGATAPDITLTKVAGLAQLSGTVTHGGTGVDGVTVTVISTGGGGSASAISATVGGVVGSYRIDVPPDTYAVAASLLPLAAPAQNVTASGNVTLNLVLENVLLVGVYADGLTPGPLNAWINKGTLGGQFEILGATPPVAGSLGQFKSVKFENNPMVLRNAGAPVLTPATITGPAANYTVCAWLYEPDPALPDQQTYLSWAKRGGPDGSNCEFVYGTNPTWGAAGHWGAPDLPWGTPPSGGTWHNVIVTWNGSVESDYIDGVFSASETKTLDIGPDLPIVLSSGYWFDGTTISPDIPFSGHIAQVEVFAAATTAAEAARLASLNPPQLPIATIKGKVVTADSSAPSGFNITMTDAAGTVAAATVTGADGSYSSAVAAPGSYTVKATKFNYVTLPAPQTAAVQPGATVTLNDFVASPGGTITGVLKDATTGLPIYNGVVQTGSARDDVRSAMTTDATGTYSLPATGCGGVEVYADAINYAGRLLLVTGTGGFRKDIALTADATETSGADPRGLNGNMEDLVGDQPAQWQLAPWNAAGSIDFKASTTARAGSQSLFYTTTESPVNYDGIVKVINLQPGYTYNWWFSGKADPEVMRWQPMVEFQNADGSIWDGFVSADPGYYEYAHTPPYDWHTYLRWFDRNGTRNGVSLRWKPYPGVTQCWFKFLFEPADGQLPPAGKGCYLDDLVLDAVPDNLAVETVGSDTTVPPTPVLPPGGFKVVGGVPTFTFDATAGFKYRIVWKNSVTDSSWTPGAWSAVVAASGPLTLTDPTAGGQPHRFYRIEASAP